MGGNGGNRAKTKEKGLFLYFYNGKNEKSKGGKTRPQARGKQRKHKKTKKNIKKRLIYFFNCDILYIVKGNESHEKHKGQAIREIDKSPAHESHETHAET